MTLDVGSVIANVNALVQKALSTYENKGVSFIIACLAFTTGF